MSTQNFTIQFHWNTTHRQLDIISDRQRGKQPVPAIYQVYRNKTYLFSIYPTFSPEANREWEILEKERANLLPQGFIGILGNMIDDVNVN